MANLFWNLGLPLHKAAKNQDLAELRLQVQMRPQDLNKGDSMGWTPLHVAADKGFLPGIKELLDRRVIPDIQDKSGRTALHLAADQGHREVVEYLLKKGASAGIRDRSGRTPYDYTVQRHPTIAALISGGQQRPPPPLSITAAVPAPSAMPSVDLPSAAAPNQLLPPPPFLPRTGKSPSEGGTVFPLVHHEQTQAEPLLPTPPAPPPTESSWAIADHPAGPGGAADVYGHRAYGEGAQAGPQPQPYWQSYTLGAQVQQGPAVRIPYPVVPGAQQLLGPDGHSSGGGGGGGARVPELHGQQRQQLSPALQPRSLPFSPEVPPPPPAEGFVADNGAANRWLGGGGSGAMGPESSTHGWVSKAAPDHLGWGPVVPTDWGDEPEIPSRGSLPSSNVPPRSRGPSDPRVNPASAVSGGASLTSTASVTCTGGRVYSYEELQAATGNFNPLNKLGEGGYGPVYHGCLDGIKVAVKVMDASEGSMQGRMQFEAEVTILSSLHHPHLVLLIGSCPDKGILVYELMPNGSLETHLFGPSGGSRTVAAAAAAGPGRSVSLSWRDRVRITSEVATALLFLHTAPTAVVHMDLKPANILLDTHLTAKLGDVGLARLAPTLARPAGRASMAMQGGGRSTFLDSSLVGTYEYMDPEYLQTAHYSTRSDIYSLGVVMLQMLTGSSGNQVISQVAEARRGSLGLKSCIDPRSGWPEAEAAPFADLALHCAASRRQDRPDLRTVILPTLTHLKQRAQLYELPQQAAPPAAFVCPITQEIMDEPVVAADGYTYERFAIAEWIKRSSTSPLTNLQLEHTNLVENRTLRSAIREWREQQQRQQGQHVHQVQ